MAVKREGCTCKEMIGGEGGLTRRVGAGRKSWGRGVYTVEGWGWKEIMG